MANGVGRLASAWTDIDDQRIKLNLTVNELDLLHDDIKTLGDDVTGRLASVQADFTTRLNAVRADMQQGFNDVDAKLSRLVAIGLTVVGGILTGLILMVVQIAR